jgi:hypothetical protein
MGRAMAARRLAILGTSALLVLVLALALGGLTSSRPRTAAEREALAQELVSGISVSARLSDSSLSATKALVDFLPENDVRLVLVRIVDDLDLVLRIETSEDVTFSEPPGFCLIGPFAAPDDAGLSSPCWGAPDLGELVGGRLEVDAAGHAMLPAGRVITLEASIGRVRGRCDYPPGQWVVRVEGAPIVDGRSMDTRRFAEVAFDVPYLGTGQLPFIPVCARSYCGLANVVYREQGEPEVASPSP